KNKNKHPNKKKASLDENRLSRKGFKGWANCSGRNLNTRAVALELTFIHNPFNCSIGRVVLGGKFTLESRGQNACNT
ncbi:hypothetical protein, partial [Parashewanella curva]|uniref:hypothetical protein n=1 Tax=Parashewanella curva TaxID=2338552 RepID=UPI001A9F9CBD